MQAQWGRKGTALLILHLLLIGGRWSTPRLGRFIPGKASLFPLSRRHVGPQETRKNLLPPRRRGVHPTASCFTDCTLPVLVLGYTLCRKWSRSVSFGTSCLVKRCIYSFIVQCFTSFKEHSAPQKVDILHPSKCPGGLIRSVDIFWCHAYLFFSVPNGGSFRFWLRVNWI
jgi:hypothetical protein